MEQFLTGYAQFLQNISKSPHTVKQYVLDAKHFVTFWSEHENDPFNDVLLQYRQHLCENYAITSVNRKLAGTRKYVQFLYDRAYVPSYSDTIFEPFEKSEANLTYLSKKQLRAIYETLHALYEQAKDEEHQFLAQRHLTMFELFITTGVKPFECVQMQWQHIQYPNLVVRHNDAHRTITLPTSLLKQLQLLKQQSDRIFDEQPYVWLGIGNKRGEPITEKTVERFFKMLSEYVGFKVTATICRYTLLYEQNTNAEHNKMGYSRKDVMTERLKKLSSKK